MGKIQNLIEFVKQQAQPKSAVRQTIGNMIDHIAYAIPGSDSRKDTGFSEWVAGGPTSNTKAQAVENNTVVKRNMSADGGTYDANGNFTPYFPGTTTPDTSKTVKAGGNNGGGNGDGTGQDLLNNANNEKAARIAAIKSKLNMMKEIADRDIATATSVRDDLLKSIQEQYGDVGGDTGLFGLSKRNRANSIQTLANEDVSLQNKYGVAAGDTRRAYESALGKNRMVARAQGALGSSNYADSQYDTTSTAARSLGSLNNELADKRATIETNKTSTNNWFNQKEIELGTEKTGLVNGANQEYNQRVNAARDLERNFGIDSEEELSKAETEYASKLTAIKDYISNKAIALAQIGATAGTNKNSLTDIGNTVTSAIDRLNSNNTALDTAASKLSNYLGYTPASSDETANGQSEYGNTKKNNNMAYILQRMKEGSLLNSDYYLG